MDQAYFRINILFYFVGREGHVRLDVCGQCADMPHMLFCYVICIMVDHQLLNVDNIYDSSIKYAIYLSILAIPV